MADFRAEVADIRRTLEEIAKVSETNIAVDVALKPRLSAYASSPQNSVKRSTGVFAVRTKRGVSHGICTMRNTPMCLFSEGKSVPMAAAAVAMTVLVAVVVAVDGRVIGELSRQEVRDCRIRLTLYAAVEGEARLL